MREADRRCIEEIGIPGAVLMDHAGKAVWDVVQPMGQRVGIVCGKGNNGGDGFVVARYALLAGRDVHLVLLAPEATITGDARTFLLAYKNLGGTVVVAENATPVAALADCDVLVDAILGTGITGEVRGLPRAAMEAWPPVPTIAIDLPSGLNTDTGQPCGCAVRAELTVTIQFMKGGLTLPGAAAYTGEVIVADIGIPDCCLPQA
jgi:NAD(P)H-hydrate epimerase